MRTSTKTAIARALATTLAMTALAAAHAADSPAAREARDREMLQLATTSGCMACHHVDPGARGPDGLPPIGPAWRDVSAKYAGQKGAEDALVHAVQTGTNPYDSHWKGKVSGLAMPPNHVAINEADTRRLVRWILALDAKR